ncbi:MAG: hypothetical protein R2854_10085 [Caldilineaceae bacterium]
MGKRIKIQGFIVSDYMGRAGEFYVDMGVQRRKIVGEGDGGRRHRLRGSTRSSASSPAKPGKIVGGGVERVAQLVAGHVNIETTLRVDGFPLDYFPVTYPFFGINSTVAGVGFNIAKALHTLGDEAFLLTWWAGILAARRCRCRPKLGLDPRPCKPRHRTAQVSHPLRSHEAAADSHSISMTSRSRPIPPRHVVAAADATRRMLCNTTRRLVSGERIRANRSPRTSTLNADPDDAYNRDHFMAHADIHEPRTFA